MTLVKVFHIKGTFQKRKRKIKFGKYKRALSIEDAIEEVLSDIGSRHHVKRDLIAIKPEDVREITNPEEINDLVVKTFTTEESLELPAKK